MKYVIDIEANALENPDRIWLVVLKCIETNEYLKFYDLTKREEERERFIRFIHSWHQDGHILIGHNILGYDWPVLCSLLELDTEDSLGDVVDTLVISKLSDYSRDGHSVEDYGLEFGFEKIKYSDFSKFTPEMETYCVRDVDITHKIYLKLARYINDPNNRSAIDLEQWFQLVVNSLHNNGFCFNTARADTLLSKVTAELELLDKDILSAFPPKEVLVREFTPKATKYGTISKTSVPRLLWPNIADYEVGKVYRQTREEAFNPSSHKQIISILNEAGWKPIDKTKTHIDALRTRDEVKLKQLQITGWKVNEQNLETLPANAPKAARLLAKRIVYEARRRTLTEWLNLVTPEGRIHGRFYNIGAWTHRMAHQNPNTANIPNEYDTQGKKKLLGKELRSLWCAPKGRLLVGCDAEGIQLRIFAHYINDPEFTDSLVKGKKDDKTDPHSLNQRILGDVCKSRAAAKRFIYALLLGAGLDKLSEILDCGKPQTEEALSRLLERYTGWAKLKTDVFPKDAARGWFVGLDGRKIRIPGDTPGNRKHLAMSGYLQSGEAICMKLATRKFFYRLSEYDAKLVNFVHDEWQVECGKSLDKAIELGHIMANSLKEVGDDLKLNCPLAGSFYNDDLKDYTIGTNWSVTH